MNQVQIPLQMENKIKNTNIPEQPTAHWGRGHDHSLDQVHKNTISQS